jgi:hypothetical protein
MNGLLKVFVDGIVECTFYTFIRPNQERLQKNATVGPLVGIGHVAL